MQQFEYIFIIKEIFIVAIFIFIASDGKPIEMTDVSNTGMKLSVVAPTMARDISRAGKTVKVQPCWEVEYDEHGYAVKCSNVGGNVKAPARNLAFHNEKADEGWKDCTASSDDGVEFTLYDGKQNYVAKVNIVTGEQTLNAGDPNNKELVALMQSYVNAFLAVLGK